MHGSAVPLRQLWSPWQERPKASQEVSGIARACLQSLLPGAWLKDLPREEEQVAVDQALPVRTGPSTSFICRTSVQRKHQNAHFTGEENAEKRQGDQQWGLMCGRGILARGLGVGWLLWALAKCFPFCPQFLIGESELD